jgi:hypothetical protein
MFPGLDKYIDRVTDELANRISANFELQLLIVASGRVLRSFIKDKTND